MTRVARRRPSCGRRTRRRWPTSVSWPGGWSWWRRRAVGTPTPRWRHRTSRLAQAPNCCCTTAWRYCATTGPTRTSQPSRRPGTRLTRSAAWLRGRSESASRPRPTGWLADRTRASAPPSGLGWCPACEACRASPPVGRQLSARPPVVLGRGSRTPASSSATGRSVIQTLLLLERTGSQQQLGGRDRQVADALTRGVVDRVRDCGGGADNADLADSLAAHRIQVRVFLIDPGHVDVVDVGAHRYVVLS